MLDAFVALIADQGLANTSMSDVAKRAGVSKTTLYTRWRDRHELVVDGFTHVATQAPTLEPDDDFDAGLDRIVSIMAGPEVQALQRQAYVELLAAAGFDKRVKEAVIANWHEWNDAMRELIERGKASGEVPADRDSAVCAEVVQGFVLGRQLIGLELGRPLRDLLLRLIVEPTPY